MDMTTKFLNREAAGRKLAERLKAYAGRDDVLVLALPRGGVPVGFEIASRLSLEFDVLIVRKLGTPMNAELAMGALAMGGALYINEDVMRLAHVSEPALEAVIRREEVELRRRELLYRGSRPLPEVRGRTVILVDDGMATGASMRVALLALRTLGPERIVVAVPVAPLDAVTRLAGEDEFVCVQQPHQFHAVGQFYEDFDQVSDEDVRVLLDRARRAA